MNYKLINISRTELAELLNYSENYINEVGFPKNEYNSYNLFDCLIYYRNYIAGKHRQELERVRSTKPQDTLALSSTKLKELAYYERIGKLLDADLVESAWQDELIVIINTLDGFGVKTAPLLVGINDIKELREKLDTEIDKLKERIANTKLNITDESGT